MELLDLIVLVVIGGFALYGFATGFVHAVTSLAGMILSLIIAVHTYIPVTQWVLPEALQTRFGLQLVIFSLILVFVGQLVGVLVKVIGKVFDVISVVPFTKTLNRFLGIVFGALQGLLVVAAVLFAATAFPAMPEGFQAALDASVVAKWVLLLVNLLLLFFPDAVERARTLVQPA